ncbi:transmembrane 4 L6 family member 5-like [Paramormyrops kingsleyae]|uniref:Transmembrane 4 L six family member 21b n=1 Tax=Paramormyrops kingsleyae TaxID=1676925 RepID=A0A3B3R5Z8_9TELE|nr:transmembrane 4 L6 family member 5-like [Paramormyrops kingsleyae]
MCTGKCAKCIGVMLYPLALISIVCNIILFFPDWKTKYAEDERDGLGSRITEEVKYMAGVIGGGIMVLIPAIHIHLTGKQGCCANRCGMFLSIGFAAVGVVGGLYCFAVSIVGLINGPMCYYMIPGTLKFQWGTPFVNSTESYLTDQEMWNICLEPKDVVQFNVGLFSTMLIAGGLEIVLCTIQVVNGLFGCLCGTCNKNQSY